MLVIVPVRIFCPLDLDELLEPWLRLQKVGSRYRWRGISGRLRHKLPIIQSRIGRFGGELATGSSLLCHSQLFLANDYAVRFKIHYLCEASWCRWGDRHDVTPPQRPLPHRPEHTKTWTFLWASGINHLTCPTTWSCMSWALSRCCLRCWFFSRRPTCIVNHCQVHKRLNNDTQPLISGGAQLYASLQTCRELPVLTVIVIIFISFAPYFSQGVTSPLLDLDNSEKHLVLILVGRPDVMTGLEKRDAPP